MASSPESSHQRSFTYSYSPVAAGDEDPDRQLRRQDAKDSSEDASASTPERRGRRGGGIAGSCSSPDVRGNGGRGGRRARGRRLESLAGGRALQGEHLLERRDAAGVEGGAGLLAQQRDRLLVTSTPAGRRVARSARRRRRRRSRIRVSRAMSSAVWPGGIALAVEPLVVVAHEAAHGLREAADLLDQLRAPLGMALDDRVLVVVERPGLLQDRVGHRELADVVDEPADGEGAEPARREPERARRPGRRAARRGGCAARCTRPSRRA